MNLSLVQPSVALRRTQVQATGAQARVGLAPKDVRP